MRLPLKFYFDWDDLAVGVWWTRDWFVSLHLGPLTVEWSLDGTENA